MPTGLAGKTGFRLHQKDASGWQITITFYNKGKQNRVGRVRLMGESLEAKAFALFMSIILA